MIKTILAKASMIYVAVFIVVLAGCSQINKEQKEDPNIYPTTYKADLLTYIEKNTPDDMPVGDAYVSTPALRQFGSESRYFVCLRTGSQDLRKDKIVVFFAGWINQIIDATREQCGTVAYQPFSELSALLGRLAGKK